MSATSILNSYGARLTFLGYALLKVFLLAESVLCLAVPLKEFSHDDVHIWRAVAIWLEQQYCLTNTKLVHGHHTIGGLEQIICG